MWNNSCKANIFDSPENQGWLKEDTEYAIDWESKEVLQRIKATLDFLEKGCSCKTAKRCSCKKKERSCGAGCECRSCSNICLKDSTTQEELTEASNSASESDSETTEDSDSETELDTEIITDFNSDEVVDLF